jgi:transglutaminase-like putative cysteine protease
MIKRTLLIFAMMMVLFTAHAFADVTPYDLGESDDGVVVINYPIKSEVRYKVLLKKDDTKYYYDMTEETIRLPLQMGEGVYELAILENVSGTTYSYVLETSFKIDAINQEALNLNSHSIINWSDEDEAIVFLDELVSDDMSEMEKVSAVHDYLTKALSYDVHKFDSIQGAYIPDIDETFLTQMGICYDFSSLLAAMLRSEGIQTKLIMGYRADTSVYHAWNEVLIEDEWQIIDLTLDVEYYGKNFAYETFKDDMFYTKDAEY